MKKKPKDLKKLTLHRESLRLLDGRGLEHAAAAGPVSRHCVPYTYTTCGTEACNPPTNTC
jgi:hypothetical protein